MDYIQTYVDYIIRGCDKFGCTMEEPKNNIIDIESDEYKKRIETYLYHDPEMEIWFQRQCRMW